MLEKNNKISILNKMLGHETHMDPPYVVPQNSENNLRQRLCINDIHSTDQLSRSIHQPSVKCEHCENMAKNFLYLESLIRTNYDSSRNCKLCHSSLQYLQYVNKNIMEVFGNFDSIVQAAKAFCSFQTPGAKTLKKRTSSMHNASSRNSQTVMKSKARKMTKSKTRTGSQMTLANNKNAGKLVHLRSNNKMKSLAGRSTAIKSTRISKQISNKKLKTLKFSKKPLIHKLKPKAKTN